MANAKPIPEGYHTVTPSLICKDAGSAIEFYKNAFGAVERVRMPSPDGKVGHAELKIGDSMIFVSDEMPQMGAVAPTAMGGFYLFLYVEDVDTVFNRAIAAGARSTMPVQDMFWGDRCGKLSDPFGYRWGIATHTEDVAPEEMDRRAKAWMAKSAAAGAGQ
jgi:PhnB protein